MALRRLPPEVARELRRHVSPRPLKSPFALQQPKQQQVPRGTEEPLQQGRGSSSLRWALGGCLALLTASGSFPLIATWWISLNDREGPLTKAQTRRGAFNNSGSTDVGRDPDWDFATGTHKLKAGYGSLEQEENGRRLPPEFHAVPPEILKKHEAKMIAFAHGNAKNDG